MKMKDYFNTGNRVRELRTEHGLSQEQLALLAEITPSYLGQVERNKKNPTIHIIEKLCLSMGVSLADFFSTSPAKPEIDPLSLQILSQFINLSNEEKKIMLTVIKDILSFRDHSQ